MPGLHALLYRSRATRELDERDLLPILTSSLRNNARAGVTGLLLYGPAEPVPPPDPDTPPAPLLVPFEGPGVFVQWLEGPEAAVRATFERISLDGRHTDVVLLGEGMHERERRLFPHWAMALEKSALLPASPEEIASFALRRSAEAPPSGPAAC